MNKTEEKVDAEIALLESEGAGDPPPSDLPRKRGRPKGSKNKPKDGSPISSSSSRSSFVYQPDATSIQGTAFAVAIVWGIAAPLFKIRDLKDEEAIKIGEALDPVIQKWLPIVGDWKYEIAAVMVIGGIAGRCKQEYVRPTEDGTDIPSPTG